MQKSPLLKQSPTLLATFARRPSAAEMDASLKFLEAAGDPKQFYEDLTWSLLNSKQFLFVH